MFLRSTRYLLTFVICAWLCLLATVHLSPHALAASDPITVTAQTDTVSFPKGIDFQMSATDASAPITLATVYIKYNGTGIHTTHIVPIEHPATTVTLQWHDDISGSNFITPGTQISYYWQVQDKLQNNHTEALQKFTVVDTRFSWQHLSEGFLQVNWYNRPADFGQAMLNQASNNIKRISNNLGGSLLHPINLWVYQTNDDFHGSLAPGSYEWVGGVAFPSLNEASIVAETQNDLTLTRDMPHELTHLIFHQLVGPDAEIPTWFDEGLAVYNQVYHEPGMKLRLKQALNTHSLLPLNDITISFPANADKAYLAYAQSWNLLDYMYNTFGQPKMATLIKDTNKGNPIFDEDLTQALGVDQPHLENQWHLNLNQPPTLTPDQANPKSTAIQNPIQVQVATNPYAPFLVMSGILLIVLPMIGLGGLFSYQRRSQPRVTLQAQNIMNSTLPAYSTPPAMNHTPYTGPSRYAAQPPYPSYQPYPPRTPPDTPAIRANPRYYPQMQEYNVRRPDKQAPQE